MTLLTWTDDLSVGVASIDNDHKKFLDLLNVLIGTPADSGQINEYLALIEELAGQSGSHFEQEEAVMERIGFPDLEPHRRSHRVFMDKVALLRKAIEGEDNPALARLELVSFMAEWFSGHLRTMDLPLRAHVARHVALNGPLAP